MVDAITTQVVRNRISSLMQEMHYHFYRSGYSTIIRESRDFSCVILDCRGGLLVAPPMFFHAPVYRHLVAKIFERYGGAVNDGDLFVCNHPYEGGLPHVSDMAFVAPIIVGGTLVGFAGSIAHKADVGGTNPGSTSANATEIFQEGLLLPPVKIYSRGVYNDDLERLILADSPNWCAATCMRRWRRRKWARRASWKRASGSAPRQSWMPSRHCSPAPLR